MKLARTLVCLLALALLSVPARAGDGIWQPIQQGLTQIAISPLLALPGPRGGQTALLASVRHTVIL